MPPLRGADGRGGELRTARLSPEAWAAVKEYQEAVWEFLEEHSEVLDSGAWFFKFHASGKDDAMKRIWARFRYGYHRNGWEATEAKRREAGERRAAFEKKRAEKAARREAHKERQRIARLGVGTKVLPRSERERLEREVGEANTRRAELVRRYGRTLGNLFAKVREIL